MNVYKPPETSSELRGVLMDEKGWRSVISFRVREENGLHGSGPRRASGASFVFSISFLSWGQAPSSLRSIDVTGAGSQC
jgi:hypothetical protein